MIKDLGNRTTMYKLLRYVSQKKLSQKQLDRYMFTFEMVNDEGKLEDVVFKINENGNVMFVHEDEFHPVPLSYNFAIKEVFLEGVN